MLFRSPRGGGHTHSESARRCLWPWSQARSPGCAQKSPDTPGSPEGMYLIQFNGTELYGLCNSIVYCSVSIALSPAHPVYPSPWHLGFLVWPMDHAHLEPDSHFAFLHFFSMGMVLIPVSCTMSRTSFHGSSGTLHLRQRVDSLEKTLMLGGFGGRRRRGLLLGRTERAARAAELQLCAQAR